ncbi:type IV pilus biogenesis/stability protein PilW [Oceanospirillum sp.]|uniref:type IV pilus biogenesis/stability protein PilW n=1 Tax=Oceanospirillum sp. TaxID=2021254 RepID=UPI003A8FEF59
MALQFVLKINSRVCFSAYLMMIFMWSLQGCSAQPEQPKLNPSSIQQSVHSYTQLGFAYLERDNIERSKRAFLKALNFDDKAYDAVHGMALIYQKEGEIELAEEYFKTALRAGGSFSVARNNYAAFLYSQGRYVEACHQLEITVEDTLYVKRRLAFENLGLCQLQLNQITKAETSFKRALQLDRNSARALLELASIKDMQNYPQNAWGYLKKHLKVAKASGRSLMLGIRLADQLGKNAEHSRYLLELSRLKEAN